ncbi:CPBP family intramembrane glutamic endopeptidase [Alicyclobacillus sp. SP_1]|uniref:CPBP family intramembrane glutamic endopeptidase n=1 Tax=Alicyclobacillus sp. SP_1 TaxID=2942475 RepID=UPI0035BE2808
MVVGSWVRRDTLTRLWDSAMFRVLVAYLISTLGIPALAFFVIYPYTYRILHATPLLPSRNLSNFLLPIPQDILYGAITLLFYFVVYRPFHLRPLLGKATGARRLIMLWLCIVIVFVAVSPFRSMLTVSNGIGILTFMITGLSEEWIFRGVLTRVFKDRLGIVWAVLIVSVLFAVSHWAEFVIVGGQKPFSQGYFIALGQALLFGLVFSIIVWRSRSILWAAFLHCIADWQPYYKSLGRPWMLDFHIPWLEIGYVQIYLMGLIGAELIRFSTDFTLTKARRKGFVDI